MRINGVYVGLGEGDRSPEVAKIKAHLKRKYTPARNTLNNDDYFDAALTAEVMREQDVFIRNGSLAAEKSVPGVINLEFKYACGYLARPAKPKPIIFTVEGHMSNMWNGPCAYTASKIEQEGHCWWQPVGYDTVKMPFDNKGGRAALHRLVSSHMLYGPHGEERPFPPGTPWGLLGFSQGAIITNSFYLNHLRSGDLKWREDSLTRAIAFGDPYREKNVDSGWWPDPPKPDTQGISDVRMTNTPHWWKSANRTGDLYTENPDNEVGLNRTAIYKIVAENSWSGGPAGILQRLKDFLTISDDIMPVAKSIMGGVMFLGNMQPHGGYNLEAPIEYMRGVAKRP